MKVKDLTEAEVDMICDAMVEKHGVRDENGWLNWNHICERCPLGIGDCEYYMCGAYTQFRDLDEEFESIIKKNH